MARQSQNGWPVLTKAKTKRWKVPGTSTGFDLAPGNPGFLLTWLALAFHRRVERIDGGIWDDWAWADRPVRGSSTTSNHASGTAIDINATRHPMGKRNTFSLKQRIRIRYILRVRLRGCIRWGGNYSGRPDDMHFEINVPKARAAKAANRLRKTPRGKEILRANR